MYLERTSPPPQLVRVLFGTYLIHNRMKSERQDYKLGQYEATVARKSVAR